MDKDLIQYSEKYNDDKYEYRHVTLPKEIAKQLPRDKLMSEYQWRKIGVQQSRGWEHYMIHSPDDHYRARINKTLTKKRERAQMELTRRLIL